MTNRHRTGSYTILLLLLFFHYSKFFISHVSAIQPPEYKNATPSLFVSSFSYSINGPRLNRKDSGNGRDVSPVLCDDHHAEYSKHYNCIHGRTPFYKK